MLPAGAARAEEKPADKDAKEAPAAAPVSASDEDCLACHTDPTTTRTSDGKPVLVDDKKWKGSIHAETSVSCVDCHADLVGVEMPHAEKLQPAQCESCHQKAVKGFRNGVHSKTRSDKKGPNATCYSCHGQPHEILASGDRKSPTHHLNQIETCAKCHDDPKLIEAKIVPKDVVPGFVDSIHGRGVKRSGLTVAPTCSSCHDAHDVIEKKDPKSPVYGLNQSKMCGKCHEGVAEKYDLSVHAQKARELNGATPARGEKEPPTCTSCHSAHKVKHTELAAWELEVTNECGSCHEESLHSYRDTFHGSVTALGFARMAKCADCHSAHDVYGKTDARSPVHGANLYITCKSCHDNANAGFIQYNPHSHPHKRDQNAVLYYAWLMMQLILVGVMGTFGTHTALWLTRSLIDRSKAKRQARAKGGA